MILLTGQDYPLKSNERIMSQLKRSRGACFLHAFPMMDPVASEWPPTEIQRYRDWHLWLNRRHVRLRLNRRIPGGRAPFGGSAYWGLPRDAILYIWRSIEREPRFVRFFRRVYDPDEVFFQTILMNSPLRERVTSLAGPHCLGLHYIDWSGADEQPKTLALSDIPALRSTRALFARKFDAGASEGILGALDKQVLALDDS